MRTLACFAVVDAQRGTRAVGRDAHMRVGRGRHRQAGDVAGAVANREAAHDLAPGRARQVDERSRDRRRRAASRRWSERLTPSTTGTASPRSSRRSRSNGAANTTPPDRIDQMTGSDVSRVRCLPRAPSCARPCAVTAPRPGPDPSGAGPTGQARDREQQRVSSRQHLRREHEFLRPRPSPAAPAVRPRDCTASHRPSPAPPECRTHPSRGSPLESRTRGALRLLER